MFSQFPVMLLFFVKYNRISIIELWCVDFFNIHLTNKKDILLTYTNIWNWFSTKLILRPVWEKLMAFQYIYDVCVRVILSSVLFKVKWQSHPWITYMKQTYNIPKMQCNDASGHIVSDVPGAIGCFGSFNSIHLSPGDPAGVNQTPACVYLDS